MFFKPGRRRVNPSRPKSPRIENSFLESLRASLKDEITSEIKTLLAESQREMLKLLKPETRGSIRENTEEEVEEETRNFYTPTKSVRISSTQNDSIACRNNVFYRKPILPLLSLVELESDFELKRFLRFPKLCRKCLFNDHFVCPQQNKII